MKNKHCYKINIFRKIYINIIQNLNKMKNRLKSHRSNTSQSNKEEQLQKSKYQSPKKSGQLTNNQYSFPQEIQYKLQKIFQQSGNRETNYINIIKQQEQKLQTQQQKYLQTLKQIKTQFLHHLKQGKNKNQHQWLKLSQSNINTNNSHMKVNSIEFNSNLKKQIRKINDNNKIEPVLCCKLTFYYFTSFIKDYIRQNIPDQLIMIIRTIHPHEEIQKDIKIIKQDDQTQNIHYILHKIPFQIATTQNQAIIVQFNIPCQQEVINYYKRREFQLELINKKGLFTYAYSKLSLNSILYYQNQPTEWHATPLSFYSPLDGKKLCQMSWKMNNRLQLLDKNQHYKIQSKNPIQIKNIKNLINYNDEESRMIQRISKFKTNTNSLLLGIGKQHNKVNAERYFENENEKIVIMHRHKKELQSIAEYKNSHKQELMGKLFNQALDKYYLTQCQIGCPKYIIFNYENKVRQHQKVFFKIEISIKNEKGKQPNSQLEAIRQLLVADILNKEKIKYLEGQSLITIPSEYHIDYDLDEQEKSVWTISGMTHPILIRFICLPLKISSATINSLQAYFQLKLIVQNQYNEVLQTFQTKIKIKQASVQNKISVHGYHGTQSYLQIPVNGINSQKLPNKTLLSNLQQLQYKWNANCTNLSLKIHHSGSNTKSYYLIINDKDNIYQIKSLQINVYSYPVLNKIIKLSLGQIRKLEIEFTFDEKTLTNKILQTDALHPSKPKHGQDQIRVLFASSKPQHCIVSCQNQTEMICKLYKSYNLDLKIQTFDNSLNPQKILIHAVNLDENRVIKRWLVQIQKDQKQSYKQTYKLSCEHGKPIKYKFQLYNEDKNQKSFRLYSSNLSILRPPINLISLLSNQKQPIQLQFCVKQQLSSQDMLKPLNIILTVSDGETFTNYLYEIMVRIR